MKVSSSTPDKATTVNKAEADIGKILSEMKSSSSVKLEAPKAASAKPVSVDLKKATALG